MPSVNSSEKKSIFFTHHTYYHVLQKNTTIYGLLFVTHIYFLSLISRFAVVPICTLLGVIFADELENLKGSGAHAGCKSPGGRVAECHSTSLPEQEVINISSINLKVSRSLYVSARKQNKNVSNTILIHYSSHLDSTHNTVQTNNTIQQILDY